MNKNSVVMLVCLVGTVMTLDASGVLKVSDAFSGLSNTGAPPKRTTRLSLAILQHLKAAQSKHCTKQDEIDILMDLASAYDSEGSHAKAIAISERAERMWNSTHDARDASIAHLWRLKADVLAHSGKYQQAEELYKKALAKEEASAGASSPRMIPSLLRTARFYSSSGHYSKAEPLLKRCIVISDSYPEQVAPESTDEMVAQYETVLRAMKRTAELHTIKRRIGS